MRYKITRKIDDGIYMLASLANGQQLFVPGKIVKLPKECAECRTALSKGEGIWKPLTNAGNRGDRICADCIAQLSKELS